MSSPFKWFERSKLMLTNLTDPYVEISWRNWFVSWKVRRLAWAEHWWYENGNMVFFAFHCIWCFPAIFVYFWKIWHFYFNIFLSPKKAFNYLYFLPEVCQPYAWLQWPHQMNHDQSHLPGCSSEVYLKITKIRHKKIKKDEFWQQIISRINQS